jgi:predicted NBD/HSP70 family sugar kinase
MQIASNRTSRLINRNLLFNLIRTRQPISRADLARVSGLQRSTVSAIVEDLIADHWIVEGSTGRLPRGRHPVFLELNGNCAVVAMDVHPTQIAVGVSDLGGNFVARSTIALPREASKVFPFIVSSIRKIIQDHKDRSFVGVGICFPGRTDLKLQQLTFAPNLKWAETKFKSHIERSLGLRVSLDNVANACALSEVWFNGGDGSHDLVVVNVSEGIGTGIFANGQLLRGDNGMAGEFGHVVLDRVGLACSCGLRGCWETLASNRAALRYYNELSPKSGARSFDVLLDRAEQGERKAVSALTRTAVELGRGMKMIASILAPKEIVVVGAITSLWPLLGPVVEAEMRKDYALKIPAVHPSYSGVDARLRSAVALVLNEGLVSDSAPAAHQS